MIDEFENEEVIGDVGNFTLAPSGNHAAICISVVVIGTVPTKYKGHDKMQKIVRLGFELPNKRHVFNESKGEEPFVVYKEYSLSMGDNSNLKKMIDSWRGEKLTKEEAKKFNIVKLLGCECMCNVVVKTSESSKQYNDIATVSPIPEELTVPAQSNKNTLFNFNLPFKTEAFMSLPEFIQNKIKSSDEYKALSLEESVSEIMPKTKKVIPF